MTSEKVSYEVAPREILKEKSLNFKKYKLALENNLTHRFEELKEDYGLINMFMQFLSENEREIFIYRFLEVLIWKRVSEYVGKEAISCQKIEKRIIDKWGVFIKQG